MKKADFKKTDGRLSGKTAKLVNRYYDALQKNDLQGSPLPPDPEKFDKEKVYRRILYKIASLDQHKFNARMWRVAASVTILLCLSFLGYQFRSTISNSPGTAPAVEVATANGEITSFILHDGTRIWLNAGSKLNYPDKFQGDTREVSLQGEAYFEVARDPERPFLIHTANLTTRVIGTSFNIRAYGDDKHIVVAVVTGKVGITTNGTDKGAARTPVFINPDQKAVYSKTDKSLERFEQWDATNSISWKEGKLVYKSAPLPEIIADIQRKYDAVIHVDEHIRDCSISVNFNNDSLNKVLKILAELVNGEVFYKDGAYRLRGRGCNR